MVSLRICLATFTMVYMTSAFQPLLRCAPPGLSALASSATTAGSWQDYQARIKNCVVAIGDRLDESVAVDAPEASFAGATDAFTPIDFDALQQELDDKSSTATSCSSLAAQLAKWHFAVVRLNPTDSVAVSGLWEHAARFYTLPHEDRLDLAGPVRPEASEDASLVVGYCAMEDNAFLETRLAPQYEFRPRFERFSGTARVGPPSQDPDPQALLAGRHVLTRAGLTAVRATERALAAPESCDDGSSASLANEDGGWARLVDDGGRVPLGSLTASVHRVCHYSSGAGKEVAGSATGEGLAAEPRKTVAFGAHTDATFFTVVPVAEVPGLQVPADAPSILLYSYFFLYIVRLLKSLRGVLELQKTTKLLSFRCLLRKRAG